MSFRQLMVLYWGSVLGPAAELLPGPNARAGVIGALGVLAAGVVLAVAGGLAGRLSREEGGLAGGLLRAFGRWPGRVLLLLYIGWLGCLLTVRLALSAQRLLEAGERDGGVWFFLLVLAGMSLWMARGGLGALGRTAEVMFAALAVTAGAVLALALFQARGINLLSKWEWSPGGAVTLALPGVNALGYGLFAAFLFEPQEGEQVESRWWRWTIFGCLALAAAQLVILACFGPELTGRLGDPFFQLAKSVGVEGGFQRLESVAVAVWTFSDLLLMAGLLWAVRRIAGVLWPKTPSGAVTTMALLPAAAGAMALLGRSAPIQVVAQGAVPLGSLIFGILAPLLALARKRWV